MTEKIMKKALTKNVKNFMGFLATLTCSKYVIALMIIIVLFVRCDNNNKQSSQHSVMTTEEYNSYKRNVFISKIAIISTFKPTLEITDYISNTSLDNIILQDIKNRQNQSFEEWCEENIDYSFLPQNSGGLKNAQSEYVYVPLNSNLAKVFYLEDRSTFIKLNRDYYNSIESKYDDEQKKKREQERQESWDIYLK